MKHLNLISIGIIGLFLVSSCSDVVHRVGTVDFKQSYDLKHKGNGTEIMSDGGPLFVIDTLLGVFSYKGEWLCTFYSIPDRMKEIGGHGNFGNGPGEFLQPKFCYVYGSTIGLSEVNKHELVRLDVSYENGQLSVSERKRLKAPYKMKKGELVLPDYCFYRLDDKHYISPRLSLDNDFYTLLDDSLQPIVRFGEPPIPEKLPPLASANRLQGKIAAHEGTMFFALKDLPYLACYRLESGQMQKQWSFYYNEAHYAVRNNDQLYDRDKTFGQVKDLDTDGQYVYLLYLDQLLSEYDGTKTEKSLANKILVFDYEGNGVAVLNLDCRLSNMALSKDSRTLYGIANLPEPTIVEFDMPKGWR
ncbi:hypothetical protein EVD33_13270 [Bacteroidales bacterium SW292]|nr:hypothetical protein [Bacteroidales bacterium SW292]